MPPSNDLTDLNIAFFSVAWNVLLHANEKHKRQSTFELLKSHDVTKNLYQNCQETKKVNIELLSYSLQQIYNFSLFLLILFLMRGRNQFCNLTYKCNKACTEKGLCFLFLFFTISFNLVLHISWKCW